MIVWDGKQDVVCEEPDRRHHWSSECLAARDDDGQAEVACDVEKKKPGAGQISCKQFKTTFEMLTFPCIAIIQLAGHLFVKTW